MPVLVGMSGLAVDIGLWTYTHQAMQSAADSAAVTTPYASSTGTNLALEANGVTGSYGFVNGSNGVAVTVNRPPLSGNYTSSQNAVEVLITQPQVRYFSALMSSQQVVVSARAVAVGHGGQGCVLALNTAASAAIGAQGSTNAVLTGCSTPIWQLVILPAEPVYWRATPHDALPCFKKPVSSMARTAVSSVSISSAYSRTISRNASASHRPGVGHWRVLSERDQFWQYAGRRCFPSATPIRMTTSKTSRARADLDPSGIGITSDITRATAWRRLRLALSKGHRVLERA